MSEGRIYTAADLTADRVVDCDVCVVGSGSGGAWLALGLVERGLKVVMLEEGSHRTRRDFDLTEATAYPTLYQELGNRQTDDLAITLLQGRTVGGGTVVNWCSSFRTPPRILDLWRDAHGVRGLTEEALAPHFDAVEERLHIAPWPEALINRNNQVLWDGLGKLGYSRGLIRRNVQGCANLGYCGLGCPIDAKQSMLVTVLPDAVERGMALFADCSARRIETRGARAVAVHAEVQDPRTARPTGTRLTVRAKTVAVSGGAINSPALLLRSGLDGGGRVGKRTFLHPVVLMLAVFDEPVNAFAGAPQSVYSHQFIDRGPDRLGFFLEVPPVHPLIASTVMSGSARHHRELMQQLPFVNACLAITVDGVLPGDEGGTVRLREGAYHRPSISYPLEARHWEAFRFACKEMARLQFAAGARRVYSLHTEPVVMEGVEELSKLDAAPWEKLQLKVVTAHQMGGCAMGEDPARSVVDSMLRYRGLDNLFVVDGSVLPTALGVNPQETLFALARWAAPQVAASV